MEKQLTDEQMKFFEEWRKKLEKKFSIPEYRDFKIKYVKEENEADIKVSKNHIITDYLAIGFACLRKSINGSKDTEIKVYNSDEYLSMDYLDFLSRACPDGGMKLFNNALYDISVDIDKIMKQYFHEEKVLIFGCGMILCSMITCHLMNYMEMPEGTEYLDFENFDDTIVAQKNAYELAKLNIITSVLGSMASLYIE